MSAPFARLLAVALLAYSYPASAEQLDLDLSDALARAHRDAPDAIAARARIAQAEAGVVGANVTFETNPEIEGGLGPRLVASRPIDADVRLAQDLEPWRRGPRRQLANAERLHALAESEVTQRDLVLEVSLAFYEALFASQLADQTKHAEDVAQRAAEISQRRRQAGEITDLDVNLARVAFGRAHAATQLANAERTSAIGKLAILIGASANDTITLKGTLAPPTLPTSVVAANRADIRALDRERDVAKAEHAKAVAAGRPDLGLFVGYQREDTDSIVIGGLSLTLPIWNSAQGAKAAARAHERSTTETRDATVRIAERQLADAMTAFTTTKQAVDTFEKDTLPVLDDSEQLLKKSIDAGQIAISDYLVAWKEILDGRREHLERQLALARAAITVRYVAGGQP